MTEYRARLTDIERETFDMPSKRSEADYLKIVAAGQTVAFSEYDNTDAISSLVKKGLLTHREGNRFTSMGVTLWMDLTEAGRAATLDG